MSKFGEESRNGTKICENLGMPVQSFDKPVIKNFFKSEVDQNNTDEEG